MSTLREEVLQFCRSNGLKLNTDLGQHYLVNQHVLDAIMHAAKVQPEDVIVEIGCGIGILTRELLAKAKHVQAIEIDERVVPLCRLFTKKISAGDTALNIVTGNALEVPYPTSPYKVVANIPYHITSPLLRHCFFEAPVKPTSLTLLIQKEVALKICDQKETSVLAVAVRLFGNPTIVCHVSPKDFIPAPKVDSSVIHIECYKEPLADEATINAIMKLVKHAFSQKRKMLRNTFGSLPQGLELLQKANIAPTRRPQTITIKEWITLAKERSLLDKTN